MHLRLISIGRAQSDPTAPLVADYAGRIEKFLRFEVEMLKAQPYERIAERVLEKAKSAQLLVVLDERGKEYDTAGFADLISSWMNQGVKSVAFVVGGADGLPAAVLKRADLKVSLSKMTLPHRLARVVLLEQIYRGLCIIRKVPYQK